ncbi:hypothetical protein GQ600_3376 [Phytophthora cactorum]|nr:hypothetical protein GQ600_3376 [Phytophthora cactorum]
MAFEMHVNKLIFSRVHRGWHEACLEGGAYRLHPASERRVESNILRNGIPLLLSKAGLHHLQLLLVQSRAILQRHIGDTLVFNSSKWPSTFSMSLCIVAIVYTTEEASFSLLLPSFRVLASCIGWRLQEVSGATSTFKRIELVLRKHPIVHKIGQIVLDFQALL